MKPITITNVGTTFNQHLSRLGITRNTDICMLPVASGLFVLIANGKGRLLDPFNMDPEQYATKLQQYVIDELKIPTLTCASELLHKQWLSACAKALASGQETPEEPDIEYLPPYLMQITTTRAALAKAKSALKNIVNVPQLVRYYCSCAKPVSGMPPKKPNPNLTKLMIPLYLMPLTVVQQQLDVGAPTFASQYALDANLSPWFAKNSLSDAGVKPLPAHAVKKAVAAIGSQGIARNTDLFIKGCLLIPNSPGQRSGREVLYADFPK